MNHATKGNPIAFQFVESSIRLRHLREKAKESHDTLGKQIGVSAQTLKNYEQAALHAENHGGKDRVYKIAGMSINTLCALADHFGVSADYLLGRDAASVKRAKWETDSDGLPVCSCCGEIALQRMFVKVPGMIAQSKMILSNYCPNCGALMKKGKV